MNLCKCPLPILLLCMLLTACAPKVMEQDPPHNQDNVAKATSPAEEQALKETPEEENPDTPYLSPPRPKIELSEELLYKFLLAEIAGQNDRFDIAVQNYLGLALITRDPLIAARAARIAVYARDTSAAERAAQIWLELDPDHPDPHQILSILAIRNNNTEKAILHMRMLIENLRGNVGQKAWFIANLLRNESKQQGVVRIVQGLMEDYTEDIDALEAFASILAYLGAFDQTFAILDRILELKPDSVDTMLSYLELLQRNDMAKEVVHFGTAFIAQFPDHLPLRNAYANALMHIKDYERAYTELLGLTKSQPDDSRIMYSLGVACMLLDRLDEAHAWLLKVWEKGEGSLDQVNYFLGRISEEQQRSDDALHWYRRVRQGEHKMGSRIRVSLITASQGDVEKGLQYIRAIQPDTKSDRLLLLQSEAEILIQDERLEEAMALFTREIENNEKPLRDILYSRALLAERMERLDITERDLRKILTDNPKDATALNALGYTLTNHTNRYQEALELITQSLELTIRPEDMHYVLDSMGWVLYRLGRMNEAVDYLRRALELNQDPEVAAHLGEVLWVMGDEKAAQDIWNSALESTPEHSLLREVIQRFAQ